ncbi:MAG: hypothetical protein AB4426_34420 [Xenococcaceae cyanobacterium]
MSPEELTDRSQTERFPERPPQGQAEFWDAVKTVTRLKRQAKAAARQAEPESWSPLVVLQPNGHKQPIFLVAGGDPEKDIAFFWGARVRVLIFLRKIMLFLCWRNSSKTSEHSIFRKS